MDMQSIRTRLVGSYLFLLMLFIVKALGLKSLADNFRVSSADHEPEKRRMAEVKNIFPSSEKKTPFEPRIISTQNA